jgi:hypothetical protein
MNRNNIYISIITLSKNDNKNFSRTLKSIISQKKEIKIEWLIIDGSGYKTQEKKKKLIKKFFDKYQKNNIYLNFINSKKEGIFGIYPCMNYGKKIAIGKFIIFLNSGDVFFEKNSLEILIKNSLYIDQDYSFIFGQANNVASKNISWFFPGNKLKNIKKWLRFFEPNHQSMMISKKLADSYDFSTNQDSLSDGYWKRQIINNAIDIVYIKTPIVKFFFDGVSTLKPSKKKFTKIIKNKNISILRKFVFLVKYVFPKNLFFIYHFMQKYKSILIDLIF